MSERGWVYLEKFPNSDETPSPLTGYRWRYPGELELSLACSRAADGLVRFEVARILPTRQLAEALVTYPPDREYAIEEISKGKPFPDIIWEGYSPNDLEQFCQESRLPLPPRYRQCWVSILAFYS